MVCFNEIQKRFLCASVPKYGPEGRPYEGWAGMQFSSETITPFGIMRAQLRAPLNVSVLYCRDFRGVSGDPSPVCTPCFLQCFQQDYQQEQGAWQAALQHSVEWSILLQLNINAVSFTTLFATDMSILQR